jgi:hypothetical protein
VLNKWNRKEYTLIAVKDSTVILQRKDGSQFEIAKSEYYFSYSEKSC